MNEIEEVCDYVFNNNSNDLELNEYIKKIKEQLENINHSYMLIGYYLLKTKEIYIRKGLDLNTFYFMSKKTFNFDRRFTCNMISMSIKFSINGVIKDEYKDFFKTQLLELNKLNDDIQLKNKALDKLKKMKCKEIKEVVKDNNKRVGYDNNSKRTIYRDPITNKFTKADNNKIIDEGIKSETELELVFPKKISISVNLTCDQTNWDKVKAKFKIKTLNELFSKILEA